MTLHYKKKLIFSILISSLLIIVIFLGYNFIHNNTAYRTSTLLHDSPAIVKAKPQEQQVITILAIDGGGVRGVIPLYALQYIERKTGKPISDLFNVIIGTSSGGITAVLLSLPNHDGSPKYSAEDVLKLYKQLSSKIFTVPLYHKVLTLNGLLGPKFLSDNADKVYQTIFGNITLGELRGHVLLPSVEIERVEPLTWDNKKDSKFFISDVLSGTTAAPIFFRPVTVTSIDKKSSQTIMDSSVYINDPALFGLLTTIKMHPNKKYLLVSLGTGYENPKISVKNVSNWGLLQWIPNLYKFAINSETVGINHLLKLISQEKIVNVSYYRINIEVPNANKLEFNGSPQNLKNLDNYGEKMVTENKDVLDEIVNQLAHIHKANCHI